LENEEENEDQRNICITISEGTIRRVPKLIKEERNHLWKENGIRK
jgi:hypothetical protein